MARKTQAKIKSAAAAAPAAPPSPEKEKKVYLVVKAVTLLGILAVTSFASQAALFPLYGRFLATQHSSQVIFASVYMFNTSVSRFPPRTALIFMASVLAFAPASTRAFGSALATTLGPLWAPGVTQFLLAVPVIGVGHVILRTWAHEILEPKEAQANMFKYGIAPAVVSGLAVLEPYAFKIPISDLISPRHTLLALGLLTTVLASFTSNRVEPTKLRITPSLVIPFFFAWASLAPSPVKAPESIRIHSGTLSTTGYISVADNLQSTPPFRLLRCDASLLGGNWLNFEFQKNGAGNGKPILGDSIYAAFVLQEAGMLAEGLNGKDALILGLGAGNSARGYMNKGFSTTIVELDEAVYNASRTYFDLPPPAEIYLEDARAWVQKRVHTGTKKKQYDVIVHDLFTGGGVPPSLFTLDFWENLKMLVDEKGVVIINYVGKPRSDALKAVVHTITQAFPLCRAFHDGMLEHPPFAPWSRDNNIADLVLFCTLSSTLTFRNATESDYAGSALRREVLRSLPHREVNLVDILGKPSEEEKNARSLGPGDIRLAGWVQQSAAEYWTGMRSFVPGAVWDSY